MHHLKELKNISWNLSLKNKLRTNFINEKDPTLKEECHTNYKKYGNLLFTLMKKGKEAYYDIFWKKKNRITLKTHGKELNPSFL